MGQEDVKFRVSRLAVSKRRCWLFIQLNRWVGHSFLFRLYKQTKFLSINQTLLVVFSESWSHSNEPHNMPLDLVYWVRSDSYDNYMHMYKFKLLHTAKISDSVELQSWPKCAGHFFPAIVAPPLRSNVGRLFGKSFLSNPIAWGEGGKGRIWPKERLFPCEKRSMVEALHSARVSHISLAKIVAVVLPKCCTVSQNYWTTVSAATICTTSIHNGYFQISKTVTESQFAFTRANQSYARRPLRGPRS